MHPDWNPKTTQYDADLALLKFEEQSIHFNNFVQPICLWDAESIRDVTRGIVVAWGSANSTGRSENEPMRVEMPTYGNAKCLPGNGILADRASERTFCAGGKDSSACFGDSGSGLFAKVNGAQHLVGIKSGSLGENGGEICDASNKAIYTNVLEFKEWIEDTTSTEISLFCMYFGCVFQF